MHRIFTLIPYLQSYNTLPFYLADLGGDATNLLI